MLKFCNLFTQTDYLMISLPSLNCPVLVDLCNQVQNTTQWIENLQSMEPLKQQLMDAWNTTDIPFWIGNKDIECNLLGLFGILESRLGNDIDFPPGVDMATYQKIVNFVAWELETLYAPKEICRLG